MQWNGSRKWTPSGRQGREGCEKGARNWSRPLKEM